jgi:hypothetical protein
MVQIPLLDRSSVAQMHPILLRLHGRSPGVRNRTVEGLRRRTGGFS